MGCTANKHYTASKKAKKKVQAWTKQASKQVSNTVYSNLLRSFCSEMCFNSYACTAIQEYTAQRGYAQPIRKRVPIYVMHRLFSSRLVWVLRLQSPEVPLDTKREKKQTKKNKNKRDKNKKTKRSNSSVSKRTHAQ